MDVTITIPEDVAQILGSERKEREHRACESIALELYREGKISLRTMGRLAGVGDDYWAADAFRTLHKMPVHWDESDHSDEEAAINQLLKS